MRDGYLGAVRDGFEEAEEGDFVGGETGWVGGGADLRYVEGPAGEGGQDQTMGERFVSCEAQELRWRAGHCGLE